MKDAISSVSLNFAFVWVMVENAKQRLTDAKRGRKKTHGNRGIVAKRMTPGDLQINIPGILLVSAPGRR